MKENISSFKNLCLNYDYLFKNGHAEVARKYHEGHERATRRSHAGHMEVTGGSHHYEIVLNK